jgi:hypothetical protein
MNNSVRFAALFAGLTKAYGCYRIDKTTKADGRGKINGRGKTINGRITFKRYEEHLKGDIGIGIVPIQEDNTCCFAAIDVDQYDIDHVSLAKEIEVMDMPLMLCRTKSGGAHLYTFFDPPVPANIVRKALGSYAAKLGIGSSEIFPKQDEVGKEDVGNWINIPFFDVEFTVRGWWTSDGEQSFENFLDVAEGLSKNNPISNMGLTNFIPEGMPPCLQYYFENGAPEGSRNEILYGLGVFLKKSSPDDIEDLLTGYNYRVMSPPLTVREIAQVIKSVKKRDYQYKCKNSIFSERCNHIICKSMKYGVGADFRALYSDQNMGCLTKYLTDPPKWVLDINGVDVEFNTPELMNYQQVRVLALERANVILPPVKQEEWLLLLKEKVEVMKTIEAPNDATKMGDLTSIMADFIQIAERSTGGRIDLLRGIPVKDKLPNGEDPVIYFRSQDFIGYLKRKKIVLNISGNDLWMAMRHCGCGHTRLKVSENKSIQTWYIRLDEDMTTPIFSPMVEEIDI